MIYTKKPSKKDKRRTKRHNWLFKHGLPTFQAEVSAIPGTTPSYDKYQGKGIVDASLWGEDFSPFLPYRPHAYTYQGTEPPSPTHDKYDVEDKEWVYKMFGNERLRGDYDYESEEVSGKPNYGYNRNVEGNISKASWRSIPNYIGDFLGF